MPPAHDRPEPALPPANDDTPVLAAKSAVVATASRKRTKLHRAERAHDDDPRANEQVKAFFARVVRPGGALPPEEL